MGSSFADIASSGPLLLAVGGAALAGVGGVPSPPRVPPGTGLGFLLYRVGRGRPPAPPRFPPPRPAGGPHRARGRRPHPGRAVTLTVAYCLGLGIPFLAFGLGLRRLLSVFASVRRHSAWVTRIGGLLLVLVGLALLTGVWSEFVNWLRAVSASSTVGIPWAPSTS